MGRITPAWPAFPSLLLAQIRATAPTNGPTVLVALALVWSHCHRHVGHPCQALLPPALWSHWPMGQKQRREGGPSRGNSAQGEFFPFFIFLLSFLISNFRCPNQIQIPTLNFKIIRANLNTNVNIIFYCLQYYYLFSLSLIYL